MLYVIGTPIGNLSDLSKRAVETLSSVDIVFAEDTRTALNLLNSQGIKKPCKSYYKDNEKTASESIIACLLNGNNVALISEAGMPCISDPGAVVIKKIIQKGLPFEIIQGPTALIHGFLPHKEKEKIKEIKTLLNIKAPVIFYESPYRVKETLNILLDYFHAPIAVTREATKVYEETIFIISKEDIENITVKGEFVITVNNSLEDINETNNSLSLNYDHIIKELLSENISSKDILKMMKTLGMKRNEAYNLINKLSM